MTGVVWPTPMLTAADARNFATAWYAAWNAHDLNALMSLYGDDIEHSSPFVARYNDDPSCAPLRGKAAVRAYFQRAIERNPTLHFAPLHVAAGVDSVVLVYRRMTGELAAETFWLDRDRKIARSVSHYGA